MQLDTTKLADLIRALRSNPAIATDKRQQPRVGVRAKAHMIVEGNGAKQAIPIVVRDLSSGGLGFTCSMKLAKNLTFQLLLSRDASQSITCQVAHCLEMGPDIFRIGAMFVQEVTATPIPRPSRPAPPAAA